jgi:hypothetical protein
MTMKRLLGVALLAIWIPALLPASEFDELVREFSRQTGSEQTHIPFFGIARFVVAVSHPAGTSDLRLAVFEHPNVCPRDFARVADEIVGGRWNRILRAQSRKGDSTNIYTRRDGNHLRLLVATVDRSDATFVEMRIKPEALMKFVDERRCDRH